MGLIELGGWMMWPLLAVSVAALAMVVERARRVIRLRDGRVEADERRPA